MRGAGGEVTDLSGEPISEIDHAGPFVAGVDPDARARVADIARKALET